MTIQICLVNQHGTASIVREQIHFYHRTASRVALQYLLYVYQRGDHLIIKYDQTRVNINRGNDPRCLPNSTRKTNLIYNL